MELEFEPPPLDALMESESLPEAEAPLRTRTPLAASVVAHTDRADEFEACGFRATNAPFQRRAPAVLQPSPSPSPEPEPEPEPDR